MRSQKAHTALSAFWFWFMRSKKARTVSVALDAPFDLLKSLQDFKSMQALRA